MGNSKDLSCCGVPHISKRHCHDLLLLIIVVNILVGLVCLYKYMGTDDKWTVTKVTTLPNSRQEAYQFSIFSVLSSFFNGGLIPSSVEAEPKRREKVLALAVFLFLSTCALCWFIMRKEQQKWECERRCLIIDRPPSYESCIPGEQPPPSYFTVVNTIRIV